MRPRSEFVGGMIRCERILFASPYSLAADMPLPEQLSQVFAHVLPPAFLFGAVAGFVGVLTGRSNRIVDRIRRINAIEADGTAHAHLKGRPAPPSAAGLTHERLDLFCRRRRHLHHVVLIAELSSLSSGGAMSWSSG